MLKKNDDAIKDETGAVKVMQELNYEFYTVTTPRLMDAVHFIAASVFVCLREKNGCF